MPMLTMHTAIEINCVHKGRTKNKPAANHSEIMPKIVGLTKGRLPIIPPKIRPKMVATPVRKKEYTLYM